MTKEEILKMEAGKEINGLVGQEVMGLQNQIAFDGRYCKDYSGSILAAWEVVEKLEHNWNLLREVGMCGTTPTEGSMQYRFILAYPNMEMVGVTAETAPLAICRAALLAVMED